MGILVVCFNFSHSSLGNFFPENEVLKASLLYPNL